MRFATIQQLRKAGPIPGQFTAVATCISRRRIRPDLQTDPIHTSASSLDQRPSIQAGRATVFLPTPMARHFQWPAAWNLSALFCHVEVIKHSIFHARSTAATHGARGPDPTTPGTTATLAVTARSILRRLPLTSPACYYSHTVRSQQQ